MDLGIYPDKTDFEKCVAAEEFFMAQVDTPSGAVLAGAFGLDSMDDSDYARASWKQQLHENEVASIHLLAVVKGNVAACALYKRHGFECVDSLSVYYESSGETPLLLFEKAL